MSQFLLTARHVVFWLRRGGEAPAICGPLRLAQVQSGVWSGSGIGLRYSWCKDNSSSSGFCGVGYLY